MSENFDAVQHARAEMQSLSRLAAVAGQELAEPTVRIAALVTGVLRNLRSALLMRNVGSSLTQALCIGAGLVVTGLGFLAGSLWYRAGAASETG